MASLRKFSPRSFDWVLFSAVTLLLAIGLSAIYSVDLSRGQTLYYFHRQLISAAIGFLVLFLASLMHYTFFRSAAKAIYIFSLAMLFAVMIFGTAIRGTRGWFAIAGFSFEPVELAKIGIILLLAYIVYHFGRRFERPLFFVGTGLVTGLLMVLVILQPDLGSALIIGAIWFGIMLLVGVRKLYIGGLVLGAAVVAVVAWFFLLHPYQKDRILMFIDPQRDPLGSGYNSIQATIAVGAGGLWGRGLGFGSQSQLRFLPEAQTDFIFTVIAEELGLAGVAAMLILYVVVFWRLIKLVKQAPDDFAAVALSGITILFFAQMVVNVGANSGLLPITGVTLPFISYGGSSLVINLFLVGVAESMVKKKY